MKKEIKNVSNWDIKDKVKLIAGTIVENDDQNGFNYFEDLIPFYFTNDNDLLLIKEKMNNLINLLNEAKKQSSVEFEKIQDMDFEDEIWYKI